MNKDEQIKWLNALNNSCNLIASYKPETKDLQESIVKMANWLFKLQPEGEVETMDLINLITGAQSVEDLENIKNKVIKENNVKIHKAYNDALLKLGNQNT